MVVPVNAAGAASNEECRWPFDGADYFHASERDRANEHGIATERIVFTVWWWARTTGSDAVYEQPGTVH